VSLLLEEADGPVVVGGGPGRTGEADAVFDASLGTLAVPGDALRSKDGGLRMDVSG